MSKSATYGNVKWSALMAKGNTVQLLGDFREPLTIGAYKSEEQAEQIVRELRLWSKGQREDEEFRGLCQAK